MHPASTLIAKPGTAGTPLAGTAYDGAMEKLRFAVIDVESTAGDPTEGRVMEVAIVVMDGMQERLRWDSLVHPGSRVPGFAKRLTGIDDALLRGAPKFSGVVRTLQILTQDRIVVAHNVRFDMTALAHEFARTGMVLERSSLCTERLSRRLIPGLEHYNLRSLCRHLGVAREPEHRALADAEATANLLGILLDRFGPDEVLASVAPHVRALRA